MCSPLSRVSARVTSWVLDELLRRVVIAWRGGWREVLSCTSEPMFLSEECGSLYPLEVQRRIGAT